MAERHNPEFYTWPMVTNDDGWRPNWCRYRGWIYDYNPATDLYHSRSKRKAFGRDILPRHLDWFYSVEAECSVAGVSIKEQSPIPTDHVTEDAP